ncbi:cysteine-rich receptor-like protein kinase, partial [Trifolium medium]|nr:cysteine-rich receptor-like protein kinase [Trifolium medium]
MCTLRYSNDSLFGVMKTETSYVYYIETKTVVDDVFNQTLNVLLDELKNAAADGDSNKKFAEKIVKVIDESSSNETIYGLAQCTPDLTKQDCTECFDSAREQFSYWCKQMKGCFYYGQSCSLRYETTPLSINANNNTESPAPQPSVELPPK